MRFRRRSLKLVLAAMALIPGCGGTSGEGTSESLMVRIPAQPPWTGPLSTRGRYIVDATGQRFKLRAGNWHGASGTWTGIGSPNDPQNHHDGERSDETPLGLDRAPIDRIVASFRELGINAIRLPFSNAMIHRTLAVDDLSVAANPQLRGKTPLAVYDVIVEALTAAGIAVILNNHTNTSRWCCGLDGNERWNASQTDAQWENDWLFMARRYRSNARVVGADLYNEVRRSLVNDPNWGQGDDHDWHLASQRVADRILDEANPDLLVIVEGINWVGPPPGLRSPRPARARADSHAFAHARSVPQARVLRTHLRIHWTAP